MGRLWEIDRLVERIAAGELGPAEGLEDLKLLMVAPPNYSPGMNALAWSLIGGSFAALVSRSSPDFITATLLSLLLFFISHLCGRHAGWKSVVTYWCRSLPGCWRVAWRRSGSPSTSRS